MANGYKSTRSGAQGSGPFSYLGHPMPVAGGIPQPVPPPPAAFGGGGPGKAANAQTGGSGGGAPASGSTPANGGAPKAKRRFLSPASPGLMSGYIPDD